MKGLTLENELETPVCTTMEEGIKHSVTATGRKLGVVPAQIHGLWRIAYVDGKSGSLPERLTGKYTGERFAKEHIDDFVQKTWLIAAEHTPKTAKQKKTKQESESVAA